MTFIECLTENMANKNKSPQGQSSRSSRSSSERRDPTGSSNPRPFAETKEYSGEWHDEAGSVDLGHRHHGITIRVSKRVVFQQLKYRQ